MSTSMTGGDDVCRMVKKTLEDGGMHEGNGWWFGLEGA